MRNIGMIEIFFLVLTAVLSVVYYKWNKNVKISRKMNWVSSVPGWPIIGNQLEFSSSRETLRDIDRLIKNHGKLIKLHFLSEAELLTADYDFVEFILGTNQVLNKARGYHFIHKWLGTGLLTSDGPKWKNRRRLETPAFHFSILEKFIECFESNGKILVDKLEKELNKESIDIYNLVNLYTLDVICEAAMGVKVNAQINDNSDYVRNVKEESRIIIARTLSLFKSNNFLYKFSMDYYRERKIVNDLHAVTYSVIDARKKELEEKKATGPASDNLGRKRRLAFLDLLLQSTYEGQALSREDIREEVDTFMFEGHDTTSSALSFSLYLLAHHPEVQKRVLDEQIEIFNDDIKRCSTYSDLNQMKYLELVIKETLRLYPSVPMFGRSTDKDTEYKGNIIPKGVNITVFCYGLLRDPDYFPNPNKFDPSRFENSNGTMPYSYIPFSAGSRNCIGQKFAMLEMKSCLSKILRNFEILPPVPIDTPILVTELTLKPKDGLKIKTVQRKW